MSHVTHIEVVIKNLDALASAAEACGCELVLDKHTYKWYGRWVNDYNRSDAAYNHGISTADYGKNCDHVIRVKDAGKDTYEVGVYKNPDGEGYVLVYDFYNGGNGLEKHIGARASKLEQQYKSAVVVSEMKRKGFKVSKSWEENGTITHEFEKTATARSWG